MKISDIDSKKLMVRGSMIDSILALGPDMEKRHWTGGCDFFGVGRSFQSPARKSRATERAIVREMVGGVPSHHHNGMHSN